MYSQVSGSWSAYWVVFCYNYHENGYLLLNICFQLNPPWIKIGPWIHSATKKRYPQFENMILKSKTMIRAHQNCPWQPHIWGLFRGFDFHLYDVKHFDIILFFLYYWLLQRDLLYVGSSDPWTSLLVFQTKRNMLQPKGHLLKEWNALRHFICCKSTVETWLEDTEVEEPQMNNIY